MKLQLLPEKQHKVDFCNKKLILTLMISVCIKRWKPEWFDALCIQCTMRISPSTGFTSTNSRFESSITQSSSHSSHSVSIIQSTMRTSLSTGFTSINFRFESLTHHLHVIPMSHSRILDNCFYINGVHFNQLPVWVINHPLLTKMFHSRILENSFYPLTLILDPLFESSTILFSSQCFPYQILEEILYCW